jgi:hypothetical protein
MKSQVHDCLKYWRVIRYFIKAKYGLSTSDLDMLLFLYSEEIFSKKKFEEFDNLLIWDGERFNRLYKEGWIEVFRNRKKTTKSLYALSFKTERVISGIYKKLSGEEIPMSLSGNPMFAKNVKYTDKVYRNMILEMNKVIRQQRRLSPE